MEGSEVLFGDFNEAGQALWDRDGQSILWDDELTVLTGSPRGLLDDGTVYVERNDTMFTWRDGTLQTAERPVGNVGPEGRVWTTRPVVSGTGSSS